MTPGNGQAAASIRVVAVFEACKGVLVLFAGLGLLSLLHKDLSDLALQLIEHGHLNPAARLPSIFIDAAQRLEDANLRLLALGAATYATVRLVEAYGLWHGRAWAEWLAAGSGALYVPFEVRECLHKPGALSIGLLLLNVAIVLLMVRALRQRKARPAQTPAP